MKKWAGIILVCFLALAGCDRMKHDFMHDAPEEPRPICGNSLRDNYQVDPGHEDGKALFQANCATCHNPLKDATGPALQGALKRWDNDTKRLYAYIRNPARIRRKDAYAKLLHEKWKSEMTAFPNLTDQQIAAILDYSSPRY